MEPSRASTTGQTPDGAGRAADAHPESRNAVIALWLGGLGFVLGFLLMFVVLTPATIVVAVRALREIAGRPVLRGRWKAWTAILLSIAAPVFWVSAFLTFADQGTFGLF